MALRIVIFGQAAFGREVLLGLRKAGHAIVGVYAPPDGGRPDPLAEEAVRVGVPLFRRARFRRQGRAIPEVLEEYRTLGAELNVMPFTTAILPGEMVEAPVHGSLCFHPSLLPRFRGGAAIPWQLILGERETGVTIFRPDSNVDTGPIVIQRGGVAIEPTDTAATLYFRKLYPLGVEAMLEAVEAVAGGGASLRVQDEAQATTQGLVDDAVARIDWSRPVEELDRLLRGCDPQPGAHACLRTETVRLFDAHQVLGSGSGSGEAGPAGPRRAGPGSAAPGTILEIADGRLILAARGGRISVGRVRLGAGKKLSAGESGLTAGDQLS